MTQQTRIAAKSAASRHESLPGGHGRGLPVNGSQEDVVERRRALVEDVEFLIEHRVHPEWWPPRLGLPSTGAVEKALRRAGRADLSNHLLRHTSD